MTCAYSELYLSDAQRSLSDAFDYGIVLCGLPCDLFARKFSESQACHQFEKGNPSYIAGRSGIELARLFIAEKECPGGCYPDPVPSVEKSRAFWAGWALAYYQWSRNVTFKSLFARVPLTDILAMYHPYHEEDILNFCEALDGRLQDADAAYATEVVVSNA